MTSNCNECGRKTPKKTYICDSCINFDPDDIDDQDSFNVWQEKMYLEEEERLAWYEMSKQQQKEDEAQFWDYGLDEIDAIEEEERRAEEMRIDEIMDEEGLTALHALTGN